MHVVVVKTLLSMERQDHQAGHVECRQYSTEGADRPEDRRAEFARKGIPQDLIFAEKSRKGWYARNRDSADHKRRIRHGKVFLQSSHLLNVLLVVHPVNDRAGTEEEESLEECVRHNMENAGGKCRYADRKS